MRFLLFTGKVIVVFVAIYVLVTSLIDYYYERKKLEDGKTKKGKWIEKGVDYVAQVIPQLALRAAQ